MPLSIEHYPSIIPPRTIFALVAPPSALILDIFALQQLYATRSITGTIIPIFTFVAGNAGPLVGLFGPESMDGKGHLGAKIDAEALRVVKSVEETGDQMFRHTEGPVINIAGIRQLRFRLAKLAPAPTGLFGLSGDLVGLGVLTELNIA
ncbi:hypothetical protein B0H13DRAFT_2476104 [Mycena leptocephala]|nr:hypothetical protein B0H13DRAFT_2476104 [Mycena leptocephala]